MLSYKIVRWRESTYLFPQAVALWPKYIKNRPVTHSLVVLHVLKWSPEISVLGDNSMLVWTRP